MKDITIIIPTKDDRVRFFKNIKEKNRGYYEIKKDC